MTDSNPSPAPPPPPPPPTDHRPLARSADQRIIAGVCGGIGEYFHIDPVIVRVAFVLLTVFGGFGVLLYLGAWLLLPEASGARQVGPAPYTRLHYRNGRTLVAVILIVIAVFAFANSFNVDHKGLLWGAALVGVGVFLLVQERWQPASGYPAAQAGGHATYAAGVVPEPGVCHRGIDVRHAGVDVHASRPASRGRFSAWSPSPRCSSPSEWRLCSTAPGSSRSASPPARRSRSSSWPAG